MKDPALANHSVKPTDRRAADQAFIVEAHATLDHGRLAELWEASEGDFLATFFQRRLFLEAFYRHMPADCAPIIVSVTERASGRLAMVLPLIMRETAVLRSIEAPDLGLADYVAPAMATWFVPDTAQMTKLWEQILKSLPKADILTLKKIPALLPGGRVNPLTVMPGTVLMGTGTKTLALTDVERKDHYFRSGLYKDGMRKLRKLKTLGSVEFRLAQTEDEALVLFDLLVEQRLTRFESLDRPEPLAVLAIREFYREFVGKGVGARQLLFGGLYIDSQCIATDLGILNGKTLHRIINSMNTGKWSRHSPGTIVFMLMLDEASQHGVQYCDNGVGEYAYKERLAGTKMQLYERHEVLAMRGGIVMAVARARRFARRGVSRFPQLRPQAEALRRRLCRWGLLTH